MRSHCRAALRRAVLAASVVLATACSDGTRATSTTPPTTGAPPATPREEAMSPIAPVRPDQVCSVVRGVLEQQLQRIDASCTLDADCVLKDVQYDPCTPPRAFKAGADVDALRDLLMDARTACGFVASPCASAVMHAACDAGRCVAREGRAPAAAPVWEAILRTADGVLDGVTVRVDLLQQVQCVAAPCDPLRAGTLTLTSAKSGLVRIDLQSAPAKAADQAVLVVPGHAPRRVELAPTRVPVPVVLTPASTK